MFATSPFSILSKTTARIQRGFTLIEIAIVIVVIGLLTSGGLLAISPVIQSAKISETKQKMATVESAILGYVIANGCMPCPAARGANATGITSNGTDYTTACGSGGAGVCTGSGNGLVPWVTLGLSENDATDAWGRRFTFAVDPTLTNSSTDMQRTSTGAFPTFTSTIEIDNLSGTNQNYTSVCYVLVSHGVDGAFGETQNGTTIADTHSGVAGRGQPENGDGDLVFGNGNPVPTGTGYFDDLVSFKSLQTIILSCGAGSCGNPS